MVILAQRGASYPLADRGADLYETPPEATRALLRCEELRGWIWEPCAGRGAIVRELEAAGHNVLAHDLIAYSDRHHRIQTGVDFFTFQKAPRNIPIVTNPPFRDADRFIRHGLGLVDTVIVLLRLAALEGEKRSDLIDRHLRRVWLGKERLPMMHREGWGGKRLKGSPGPFAWFVFEASVRATHGFEMRRMSWRGGDDGEEVFARADERAQSIQGGARRATGGDAR